MHVIMPTEYANISYHGLFYGIDVGGHVGYLWGAVGCRWRECEGSYRDHPCSPSAHPYGLCALRNELRALPYTTVLDFLFIHS